jgi:hypothetical protein
MKQIKEVKKAKEGTSGRRPETIPKAAERLNVSPFVLREAVKSGLVRGFQLGPRCWRVLPDDVDRLLAGGKPDPA